MNNKNIIELAKAFVIIALEGKEITFLEGKRIKKRIAGDVYHTFLKIKLGEEIQEWYFELSPIAKGQFGTISVGIPAQKSFQLRYYPFEIREEKKKEGGLDYNPDIKIDTTYGGVYVEKRGDTLHYYLIVSENGVLKPDTIRTIRFVISDFPPDSDNISIRVRSIDTSYAKNFLLERIPTDSTSYKWLPSDTLTGITEVSARYANPSNPDSTYNRVTPKYDLTLEKVVTGSFDTTENYKIYFCRQFFVNHPQGQ